MPRDLLLEIGTEEIPAGYLDTAMRAIAERCQTRLGEIRLAAESVQSLGTPRRLTLFVKGLADRQEDLEELMVGPPAGVAFKDGKPTKAAEGFAKRNGVPLDALRTGEAEGKKGEYLLCTRSEVGKSADELLPELLLELIDNLPWPKSMRWGAGEAAFVRPVHWIVCLLGGKVVPLSFAGIASGNKTRGHRFLANKEIELDGTLKNYSQLLREAFVIVDPAQRQTMIGAEIARIEGEGHGSVRPDPELVAEVANLVEYPVGICGEFPAEYLEVPERVIVSAMRAHQRYFAMSKADGSLQNRFVTIAGTITKDADVVRRGNQRVLAARLADAQFFFAEDRKHDLAHFAAKLGHVVFQKKLGSIGDKVERIVRGAEALAGELGVDKALASRVAGLCKADLSTQMVYEFPDLQGSMGRRYAELAGEPSEICVAIEEHYMPRGASDDLPSSDLASVVGIADRLDTIAGCFAIGVVPTGSADPFGLRRAALGVLRLVAESSWKVDLAAWVSRAVEVVCEQQGLKADRKQVSAEVLEFLRVRLRGLLTDGKALPADCVDAALAIGFANPSDARARAEAVSTLRAREDFEPLAAAFKRIANILKGQSSGISPDPAAFVEDNERSLWSAYENVVERVDESLSTSNYVRALQVLAELKGPVDSFFDAVLVMDKDERIRDNRLAMLGRINDTFSRIADFRQLAV